MRTLTYLLTGSLILLPSLSFASACHTLTEQIYRDTTVHSESLNQSRPWMCLSWLQNQLGAGHSRRLSATQTRYTWTCDNESVNKLTVIADNNDKITNIEGNYSSERGAGIFYAPIDAACKLKTAAPKIPKAPSPIAADQSIRVGCDVIAEQIYDIAAMSIERPYSHLPFPWESRTWLEQTFGQPTRHVADNTVYFTWHCEHNRMTTIAYSELQPGIMSQFTTLCKGTNCFLASVSRVKNTLHGTLKTISPIPS